MSSARELLEGASVVIDAWLLQSGEGRSVRSLQGALDVGGRALLTASDDDRAAAERYRRSLLRLQQNLPAIEDRLKQDRLKLAREKDLMDRAAQWVRESRGLV